MLLTIAQWLATHQIPCRYKQLFGIACPMCGGQRAIVLLFQGEVWESIKMFPPLFPILFTVVWFVVSRIYKSTFLKSWLIKLLIIDAAFLVFNCVYQNIIY